MNFEYIHDITHYHLFFIDIFRKSIENFIVNMKRNVEDMIVIYIHIFIVNNIEKMLNENYYINFDFERFINRIEKIYYNCFVNEKFID